MPAGLCPRRPLSTPATVTPLVWDRSGWMGVDCSYPGNATIWTTVRATVVVSRLGYRTKAYVVDDAGVRDARDFAELGWNLARCRPIGT